ncbi:M6 family metalloprotease domain-containing protein [Amycolatopsis sp. H20-H5]|uniref:M6 family metalloprotease domain-containing protein n=1 Tax=Amycolatopsis sp. H20-H5 TaxID=3046309 RepID=UPI002DBC6039|nr:M6 family metalloprotease domain-containing protein [Amycolatopsis sp. H20-H5]MEC3980185.1 M6 family metalloprotease domain-containing protein [Amycolatopsis sp. H20-H5]
MRTSRTSFLLRTAAIVAALALLPGVAAGTAAADPLTRGWPAPIDASHWENQDHMTWDEYRKIPDAMWADPSLKPTDRTFRGAVVLADYPDEDFAVTQAPHSTVFGNPSPAASNIPRANVAKHYQDFLNKPEELNHGHTINEYWMEDSGGRIGVDLTAFGPYRMPGKSFEYGMEFQPNACPPGANCQRDLRVDAGAAWRAEVGDVSKQFDFVFFLSAGQDESSTWQEFGEMKFGSKDKVPAEFGPGVAGMPNYADTRYVPWTSWKSAASIWPNAANGSSTQAESSGMAVYAHEFSHILGIGDNYNNPFGIPASRSYTGPWEMLSRGSFNGPGGTHTRWQIPATQGASMGAQHMVRNKMKLKIVDPADVLMLDRNTLAKTGPVSARVTARSVVPEPGAYSGINIALTGGDKSPKCNRDTDPLCDGGGYDNYTAEVVDRMGTDSFAPDAGVLLAKTKNKDAAPFEWIVDANPADIGITDYTRPDGTSVKITIGDQRQLNDAAFKAGTGSASKYEYTDQANRLHFLITDVSRDRRGVLSYTITVASLDGSGSQARGVSLLPALPAFTNGGLASCSFPVFNTGNARGAAAPYDTDTYRLSATTSAKGWEVRLPNELSTLKFGGRAQLGVDAKRAAGADHLARVQLTATSVSDPSKKATSFCSVFGY